MVRYNTLWRGYGDGVETVYMAPQEPDSLSELEIYIDNVQTFDWTRDGTTVTFNVAPEEGSIITMFIVTDLSNLPEFTQGNLNSAATMNSMTDILEKVAKEAVDLGQEALSTYILFDEKVQDAVNSAEAAAVSEANALDSENAAAASENKAHQWAQEAEDTEVDPGEYSAYHWAKKAENYVASENLQIDGGNAIDTYPISTYDSIKQRADSLANWETVNPILSAGEPAWVTDRNKRKVGDGSTPFSDLPWETGEPEGWVNVKDFGAVGDGVTDDTQAIQDAINSENNVFFPQGNYLVTSNLNIKSNTKLFGNKTTINSGVNKLFNILNVENIILNNFEIIGQSDPSIEDIPIYVENSTDITIANCRIHDSTYGIDIVDSYNINIYKNTIYNIFETTTAEKGIAILIPTSTSIKNNIKIYNNFIYDIDSIGIYLSVFTNSVYISNNLFKNVGYKDIQFNTTSNYIYNVVIDHNYFYDSINQASIIVNNAGKNIKILNNYFSGLTNNAEGTIIINNSSENVYLVNNSFININSTANIYLNNSTLIHIRGNYLTESIQVINCTNIMINDNSSSSSSLSAILIDSTSSNVDIINNHIIGGKNGVNINSSLTTIKGNQILESLEKGIIVTGDSNIIESNTLKNNGTSTPDTYAQLQNIGNNNNFVNNMFDGTVSHYDIFIEGGDYNIISLNNLHSSSAPFKIYIPTMGNNLKINNIS